MKRKLAVLLAGLFLAQESQAIIIIPIPNLKFPPALGKIRDALEKSSDTKALATVGEDKTFGARYWVWGQEAGKMTQADADAAAMRKCEVALERMKSQTAGGQPLYNFGSKHCELYKFSHITLNLPDPAAAPAPAPAMAPPPAEAAAALTSAPAAAGTPEAPVPAAAPIAPDPAAVSAAPARDASTNGSSGVDQRMRDLDALYIQNLITKDEYERKKKQILDAR